MSGGAKPTATRRKRRLHEPRPRPKTRGGQPPRPRSLALYGLPVTEKNNREDTPRRQQKGRTHKGPAKPYSRLRRRSGRSPAEPYPPARRGPIYHTQNSSQGDISNESNKGTFLKSFDTLPLSFFRLRAPPKPLFRPFIQDIFMHCNTLCDTYVLIQPQRSSILALGHSAAHGATEESGGGVRNPAAPPRLPGRARETQSAFRVTGVGEVRRA